MLVKKQSCLITLGGILLLATTNTFAILSSPYGWYLEANAGASKLYNQPNPSNGGSITNSNGIGGSLILGYKFMPFTALEVGYTQYSTSTIKDQFNNTAGEIKNYAWDIAGKGIVPWTDTGIEGFAKMGWARIYARTSVTNTTAANNIGLVGATSSTSGFYFGVGGQYYLMPEFAVVAQWSRVNGGSTGTNDLYSIGVSFIL